LRGDARGWVDDGKILPPSPPLERADARRLKHPMFLLPADTLSDVGAWIGKSLIERLSQRVLALTVQTWHVHFVVAESATPIADVVRCAKEAVRYGLRAGRPIWTADYDKRFCFDEFALQ
jgi:hypothetical protein